MAAKKIVMKVAAKAMKVAAKAMKAVKKTEKTEMKKATKKVAKKGSKKTTKTVKKTKKVKKVSIIARGVQRKSQVFNGKKAKTVGGLKKENLMKNKQGNIVSKNRSEYGKKIYEKNGLAKFTKAVMAARKALGIKGWQNIGGKTPEGQALLKKARSLYRKA
jgi:hypothetical protein